MALTKSVAAVDACQEVAQGIPVEGTTVDVSACYSAALHIDFALTNATAHTGTKIKVQISSNTTGDEDWTDLYDFVSITGTTNLEAITNNPLAVGGVTITVANTTGYVAGQWIFLEDATFANSEWCFITAIVTNTSVTILDGVTRQHANTAVLNSIADHYIVSLPDWANRVRVVYDNSYDADGATVAVRCRISKLTGV